jgi:DNA-binding NarL/FixJ family response regulator
MVTETKVLLVDDHAIVREGLRMILEAQPGMTVVGEAEDGLQALALVEKLAPDVVVMDIAMPNLNGADATRQIVRRFPSTRVVVLTMQENQRYVKHIIKAGAAACVLKRAATAELRAAITAVATGDSYFSPPIARMLLSDYRPRIEAEDAGQDILTDREREVLQLVAEGRTNQEIAEMLGLSVNTVQTHRMHLMQKLHMHDRSELVKYAIQAGMIPGD